MSDEDDTPTFRRPHIQSGNDRDLSARSLRRRANVPAHGVPVLPEIVMDPRDTTDPWDLLDREYLTDDEQEVVRRSRRDSNDPATYKDIVKLTTRILRPDSGPRIEDDIAALKRQAQLVKWVGAAVLTAALGSLGLVIDRLWARAEHEGGTAARIERLEQDVNQLLRDERSSRQAKDQP